MNENLHLNLIIRFNYDFDFKNLFYSRKFLFYVNLFPSFLLPLLLKPFTKAFVQTKISVARWRVKSWIDLGELLKTSSSLSGFHEKCLPNQNLISPYNLHVIEFFISASL